MEPSAVPRLEDQPFVCAECGRAPRDHENPSEQWRAYVTIYGLPVRFCPECAEREFGDT